MSKEIKTALLISGGGSTAEAILTARKKGELDGIHPIIVIASKYDIEGIEKAKAFDVPVYVLNRKNYATPELFGHALLELLRIYHVDLISQNGWLPRTPDSIVSAYAGRIINQHPGPLDPGRTDFGGKGMYGVRVTGARLAYAWLTANPAEHWTEATVHHVTAEYDKGKLIAVSRLQFSDIGRSVTVAELTDGLSETYAGQVKELQDYLLLREHALVVHTLRKIGQSQAIPEHTRIGPVVPDQYIPLVEQAKHVAIQVFP